MDLRGFGLSDDDLRQLGYEVGGNDNVQGEASGPQRPQAGRGRRSAALRLWVCTLAFLSLVTWGSSLGRGLPSALPVTSSDTLFSADRALALLAEISREPHPTGSPEHDRIRTYLVDRLRALGVEPEVQVTTSFTQDEAVVWSATVRNVIARVPGLTSTGAVVLRAHYDGAPLSPGAGDDALGIATVLETVRALLAGGPLPNDIIVLLTDGDELRLLGSHAFADHHSWMQDV